MKRFKIYLWSLTPIYVGTMVVHFALSLWLGWVAWPVTVLFWQSILWPWVEKIRSTDTSEAWRVVWESPAERRKYDDYFDFLSRAMEFKPRSMADLLDDEPKGRGRIARRERREDEEIQD